MAPLPIITAVVPAARPPLVVKIPGCCMKDASRRNDVPAAGAYGSSAADEAVHDIACVPDFRKKSTRSGRWREPGGDVADVAFSAGPSGGVQLSHLPDPRSVREAMAAPDADGWMVAMDLKMESLWSHDVFDPVPRASDMRTLRLGWVLHRNFKDGSFDKNKARLVARRIQQRPGSDYGESFSPVMRLESLRILLALVASCDLEVIQFDVTSAYLHGTLNEELFAEQPDGYAESGKERWVWRLKKGLYRPVQAGRSWNEEQCSYGERWVCCDDVTVPGALDIHRLILRFRC